MIDMRPDYWKPWWVAYAEFDGRKVVLADNNTVPPSLCDVRDEYIGHPADFVGINPLVSGRYRYHVKVSAPCRHLCCCPFPDDDHADELAATDDLDEAWAAYHRACEELRSQ